jgi:hypothetical protein
VAEQDFTIEEWRTLQFAPFWVFSAILGANCNFDPLEYASFERVLESAASTPGQLSREVLASVVTDRHQLVELYGVDRRTIASGLCAVAAILKKTSADEATMFRDAMATIGAGVARARGRFGQVMSDEDAKTLELVTELMA